MAKQDLILLALDPSPILGLMERTLHAADFEVAIANDAASLNKCLMESVPSLMIIGEKFSDQNGFSVSRDTLERFPTLPIILYA